MNLRSNLRVYYDNYGVPSELDTYIDSCERINRLKCLFELRKDKYEKLLRGDTNT